ncbi:hypothetical protein JTB14_033402 [Gonioctena quinquepunctata]|nr:hypothetical protein JTB14_033402 [Gonioctena quinquepunctata]
MGNAGKTVTIYDIPKLAALAIPQAFKQQNIQRGFEKPGIWPFNSKIFSDKDFLCSSVIDSCLPDTENVPTEQPTANQVPAEQSQMDATSSNNMAASGLFQFESPIKNPIVEAETIIPAVRPYPKGWTQKADRCETEKRKNKNIDRYIREETNRNGRRKKKLKKTKKSKRFNKYKKEKNTSTC